MIVYCHCLLTCKMKLMPLYLEYAFKWLVVPIVGYYASRYLVPRFWRMMKKHPVLMSTLFFIFAYIAARWYDAYKEDSHTYNIAIVWDIKTCRQRILDSVTIRQCEQYRNRLSEWFYPRVCRTTIFYIADDIAHFLREAWSTTNLVALGMGFVLLTYLFIWSLFSCFTRCNQYDNNYQEWHRIEQSRRAYENNQQSLLSPSLQPTIEDTY